MGGGGWINAIMTTQRSTFGGSVNVGEIKVVLIIIINGGRDGLILRVKRMPCPIDTSDSSRGRDASS